MSFCANDKCPYHFPNYEEPKGEPETFQVEVREQKAMTPFKRYFDKVEDSDIEYKTIHRHLVFDDGEAFYFCDNCFNMIKG